MVADASFLENIIGFVRFFHKKIANFIDFFMGRPSFVCLMFQCCHGEQRGEGLNVPGHECAKIVIKGQAVFG